VTEEILKIRAEELKVIRLVFPSVVHEVTLPNVAEYASGTCEDAETAKHLIALGAALLHFSSKATKPSIEFVVSHKP
jgi:hypothetical protein